MTTVARLGRITLNRPRAINALTPGMLTLVSDALQRWLGSDEIVAVLVDGAGTRGFCAGADIRALHADALSGSLGSVEFFRAEYRLNHLISTFAKPYVALMDGIVMGGGVGLSAHGSVRVVTERSKVAMPEVTIGLIPDVGGTLLLARAPGELGTHFGLTGLTLGPGDAIGCGLADVFVPSVDLPGLADELARSDDPVDSVVARWSQTAPAAESQDDRAWIDQCYASDSAEEIIARLQAHPARGGQPSGRDDPEQVADIGDGDPAGTARGSVAFAGSGRGARCRVPAGDRLPAFGRSARGDQGPGDRQGPEPAVAAGPPG